MGIPFFLEQLLSNRLTQHFLIFQYGALLIPFLYYSAIQGCVRVLSWRRLHFSPQILFFVVFFAAAAALWADPYFPLEDIVYESQRDLLDEKRDLLVKEIPKDAAVMATFEFLPHLSSRRELYSFHHLYTGKYTFSKKAYHAPKNIQYLLIDFNDPMTYGVFSSMQEKGDRVAREFLETSPFRVVRSFEDLVLFEKGEGGKLFQVEWQKEVPTLLARDQEGKIGLFRWRAEKTNILSGEALPLVFNWYCIETSYRRYGLLFEMTDKEGKRVRRHYHSFCYRIYPTERWQKGENITEKYQLVIPPAENGRKSVWTIALYLMDEKDGTPPVPFLRLGDFEVEGESL